MDRYCPECNSTMTPSLVGHLCTECGHMQRFYTASAVAPSALDQDQPTAPAPETITPFESSTSTDTPEQKKIRSTLKRLMVPELSPPHHHQLITGEKSLDSTTAQASSAISTQMGQTAPQIMAEPATPKKSKAWVWVLATVVVVMAVAVAALYLLSPSLG